MHAPLPSDTDAYVPAHDPPGCVDAQHLRDGLASLGLATLPVDRERAWWGAPEIAALLSALRDDPAFSPLVGFLGGVVRAWTQRLLRGKDAGGTPEAHVLTLEDGRKAIVEERCGHGGCADVWSVRLGGRRCLGKFLRLRPGSPLARLERCLRNEIGILRTLPLPGVPRLLGAGELDGHPFFLQEFIRGVDWRTLLEAGSSPLPLRFLRGRMLDCADTLARIHGAGIVHGDIKPDNILLGPCGDESEWRCWIIDFGLARRQGEDDPDGGTGLTIGTHGFVDPRCIGHPERRDNAADVYALGATFYEWYAGEPLFTPETWRLVLQAAYSGEVRGLGRSFVLRRMRDIAGREERDASLERLIGSMLLPPAEQRPSAAEIAARLARMAFRLPLGTVRRLPREARSLPLGPPDDRGAAGIRERIAQWALNGATETAVRTGAGHRRPAAVRDG